MKSSFNSRFPNPTLPCFIFGMVCIFIGHAQVPDFAKLTVQLRAAITNKTTTDDVLLESISRLGKFSEPPSFWTKIANDPQYSRQHRTRAVFALFRRHGEWSGEAHLLGKCLMPAKWLEESSIEKVPYEFGKLPVDVNPGESVFSISVLHGPSIYVKLAGNVDVETFNALLRGNDVSNLKREPTILQYGYGDDYDDWLRGTFPVIPEHSPSLSTPLPQPSK